MTSERQILSRNPVDETASELAKRPIRLTYKAANSKYNRASQIVEDLEAQLRLNERWHPGHPEYIKMTDAREKRRYRRASDHLQRLVIQRLFELQKGHLESTGMADHQYICRKYDSDMTEDTNFERKSPSTLSVGVKLSVRL